MERRPIHTSPRTRETRLNSLLILLIERHRARHVPQRLQNRVRHDAEPGASKDGFTAFLQTTLGGKHSMALDEFRLRQRSDIFPIYSLLTRTFSRLPGRRKGGASD